MKPDGVGSGTPLVYSKFSPGLSTGSSPTTPAPRTSCKRPCASVMRQWRVLSWTVSAAIGERDGIGPEEIAVLGRGTLGQEARGRRDLDLAGHGTIRGFGGIHRRAFSPNPGFLSRMSSTLVNSLSSWPATVAMTRLPSRAKAH